MRFWLTTTALDSVGFPLGVCGRFPSPSLAPLGTSALLVWRVQVISALWPFPNFFFFQSGHKPSIEVRQRDIFP